MQPRSLTPSGPARSARGFTLVELLVATAVITVLAAISLPGVVRARLSANEASAIGSLRSINSGQHVFWCTCGSGHYAPTLQNLGLAVGPTPGYISPDLAGPAPVVKSGYRLDMGTTHASATTSCNGAATGVTYHATADPVQDGQMFFGTNGGGALYQSPATLLGVMSDDGAPPAPAVPIRR